MQQHPSFQYIHVQRGKGYVHPNPCNHLYKSPLIYIIRDHLHIQRHNA